MSSANADSLPKVTSISPLQSLRSASSWIASLPASTRADFLDQLDKGALRALPFIFEFWAHDHQLPPSGNWRTWVCLGGRGAGKTRAGAEWVRSMVEGDKPHDEGRARSVALVGETYDQVREVMVFGPSGILASTPPDRRPEWQATRRRLVWPNGAVASCHSAFDPEGLRGPQFDAAWVDEIGCGAIDKGTNQPNKFLDPKSSESSIPWYSDTTRDDLIQAQYLRALSAVWNDPIINIESDIYGAPMVDMSKAHVWAYDTRPYPAFPARTDVWSDGANFARGHWISGRLGGQSLASVVASVCEAAGVRNYDVSRLYGTVRGFAFDGTASGRSSLQPLMLAYGFDAFERGGILQFRSRLGVLDGTVGAEDFAQNGSDIFEVERIRSPEAEVAGRIRLNFTEADGDYAVRSAEAALADGQQTLVDQSEIPLVLTGAEARAIVERWLAESRVAREKLRFSLPPSRADLGAGDVVNIPIGDGSERVRLDRADIGGMAEVEAVRVEANVYAPSRSVDEPALTTPVLPGVPVLHQFLELPLLRGSESPVAPYVAVTADPWPGGAAVFGSSEGDGFELVHLVEAPSVFGVTQNPLEAAQPWVMDRGEALLVQIGEGTLASATTTSVMNGANLAAIGNGAAAGWEVFQFTTAEQVGERTWALSGRYRGQAGTEVEIPLSWPVGSQVVFLNSGPAQLEFTEADRGLERIYRVGPINRSVDDASFVEVTETFLGVGLRPYAPVHLRAEAIPSGLGISWVRRTRVDGDNWQGIDVPLGETREAYLLRISKDGAIVREVEVSEPGWTYASAAQAEDGVSGTFEIEVAQLSDSWGAGAFARMVWNG